MSNLPTVSLSGSTLQVCDMQNRWFTYAVLVEVAGIEPASANSTLQAATCLVQTLI